MRLVFDPDIEGIRRGYDEHYKIMEHAAQAAARISGARIKKEGDAVIRNAGFGQNWTQTFKVNVYPENGNESLKPTVFVWHRIPYAGVFEEGETIKGQPLMFLPTRNAPEKIGGLRPSPSRFRASIGPLVAVRKGARIFLVGKAQGAKVSKIMFVGLPQVRVPQKWFSIDRVVESAARDFEGLYFQNLIGG